MGRFVRSGRTVRGLIAWRQSAAPLHFLEDCRVEKVQLVVTQMLDGFTQVLRQHMSLRGRIAWLCDRNGTCWRWRPASDHLGREKVRCRLLTTIASHGRGIMPLAMSISNFGPSPAAIKKYCPAMGDSRDGDKSQRAGLCCFCNDTMNDGGSHEHHVSTELRNADQPEW
jgi:hypothetical protein